MLNSQKALYFITEMVLLGKVDLNDVPIELRMDNISLYIAALRRARGVSIKEYKENLEILKSDLELYSDINKKHMLYFYEEMKENIKYCKK